MLSKFILNRQLIRLLNNRLRTFSSKSVNKKKIIETPLSEPIESDVPTPVVYTKSKASKLKAADSFRYGNDAYPPSQYYFVTFSAAAFLIYFCILREENDIDEKLYTPFAGNEKIYKTMLEVQLKKTSDPIDLKKIKNKIEELDAIIKSK